MVPRKQGLIINISSFGGVRYLFNVAYGVGKVLFKIFSWIQSEMNSNSLFWPIKAACDRMAVDCGIELKKQGVVMLSLYPGAVKTELVTQLSQKPRSPEAQSSKGVIKITL